MKVVVHITATGYKLPDHVFHKLLNIHPEGASKARYQGVGDIIVTGWTLDLPIQDPRATEAIELLMREGWLVGEQMKWKRELRGVTIWLDRKYSRGDLESSPWLAFDGTRYIESYWRTAKEELIKVSAPGSGRAPLMSYLATGLALSFPIVFGESLNRPGFCTSISGLLHQCAAVTGFLIKMSYLGVKSAILGGRLQATSLCLHLVPPSKSLLRMALPS
jgi:hypothetical protein